jgi:Inner membrane protein YgaP-like, transmembrane domain
MKTNVGNTDKIIRVAIAVVAVLAAFAVGFGSLLGILLLAVAVIMVVTAATGMCPIYRVLGLHTDSVKSA